MSTLALNNLANYILSLGLSQRNRKWLADRLVEPDIATHVPSEETLEYVQMPCCFTDEEWKDEVRISEEEGVATDDEVEKFFQSWRFAE